MVSGGPGVGLGGAGMAPGGPGVSSGGPRGAGSREPGTGTGGRAPGGRSGPVVPRPRLGAGTVTPPPASTPSASVRPASGGTPYGRAADSLDSDFGGGSGYADASGGPHGMNGPKPPSPGVYGGGGAQVGSAQVGNTYGRPAGEADNAGYRDVYEDGNDYGAENYGYDSSGYTDEAEDAYEGPVTGDPNYKARRHRPSANDTNVGTLADFAAYGGYDRSSGGGYDRGADERYVQGYDPNGYGRW
jgi:hypothetical protein